MNYSSYALEDVMKSIKDYQGLCNIFFSLASNDETKRKLEDILYKGGYNNFGASSKMSNKDNPLIEGQRRISLAYLLIRNPEAFEALIQNQINLFHGTNANALPSILKYGLTSLQESEKRGVYVSTGERWSRTEEKRNFISFTDVLDVAVGYSTLNSTENDDKLSFNVVIGTTITDVQNIGTYSVSSDVPEIGVRSCMPLESIKILGVPSDKVDFVKKLIGSANIDVIAMDDANEKFYWVDDMGFITISQERLNNLRFNLQNQRHGKKFSLVEIKDVMWSTLFTHVKTSLENLTNLVTGGRVSGNDGRKH